MSGAYFPKREKHLARQTVQSTVGKKKNKTKDDSNLKDKDRPGRKDLVREVERLQGLNEALRARLERIAEIATAQTETAAPAVLPPPDNNRDDS